MRMLPHFCIPRVYGDRITFLHTQLSLALFVLVDDGFVVVSTYCMYICTVDR